MRASRLLLAALWFGAAMWGLATETLAASAKLEQIVHYPLHSASATALSLNNATLSAQLQAEVEKIPVRVSQRVSKGDELVTLDCADYRLALQLAQARVRAAEARRTLANSQRERAEQLIAKQLTSQEVVDTSIAEAIARAAELDEAQIGQRQAALDVSRCTVAAPFDGIVTERNIAEGQLASVGSPLLTMVETDRLELSARIDPVDIPLLQQSNELFFEYGKQQFPVTVSQLGGVVDPATRNQEVRFVFSAQKPPPGTAGKLVWRDPRPFIAPEYIVMRDQRYGIFIERHGVAEFIPLESPTPGRANPVNLPLETLVVTDGLGTLKSGDAL